MPDTKKHTNRTIRPMKHTNGPWNVDPEPYCDGGWYIQSHNGMKCVAMTPEDLPSGEEGEQLANARLIASAPDLLEALREIEDVPAVPFSRDQLVMATRTIERIQEIARAAIAKAEGLA